MPNGETQFVTVDDKQHVLAEGSVKTACYADVPYGSEWTTTQPDDLCDECADKAGLKATTKGRRWTKEVKDGAA